MPTVAKGQVDLEVNKDQVTKDISGLGGPLGAVFGKLGGVAGGMLGGTLGPAFGKIIQAMPGGPLGAVTAGVAVGAVAIGASLFALGKEFDGAYKQIQKQTGATGKEFEALQTSFKNVAKNTGASFEDIATAVGTVSQRTGATGKDLDALSLSMLRMSSITGKDLGSVLESTTKLFNNFQIPVEQMPAAMDKLYVASAKTGVGVDQLSSSTQQFGPVLRQMGFGFDDSIALLASFDKAGINTSKVTGGMGIALGNLAKAGEKDLPGAFAKAVDAINSAGTQAEANSIAVELFGKRAGPQMAEAIRSGAFSIEELKGQLGGAEGALKNTASETATFSGKMAKFKNQMKVAFEPAAMGLFDAITGALISVTPLLTKFAEILSGVIKFLTQNKAVFTILAAAFAAFGIVLVVVTIKVILATTAFGALAVAVIAATWPILAIIAAVALIAIGLVLLWKNCETFRTIVTGAFKAVAAAFTWIVDAAKTVVSWIVSNWPILVTVLLVLLGPIGIVAAAIFLFRDQIIGAIKTVIKWFSDLPGNVIKAVSSFGSMLVGWITGAVGALLGALTGSASAVFSFFAGMPGRILGALGGLAGSLAGVASGAMSAFGSAISGGIGSAMSAVAGIPGRITGALGDMGRLLFDAGAKVIGGLVEGITSKISAVTSAIGGIASSIRGALPFSPAKWGPLSGRGDPFYGGQNIASHLASGITDSTDVVAAAAAGMAGAAAVGISGTVSSDAVGGGLAAQSDEARLLAKVVQLLARGTSIQVDGTEIATAVSDSYGWAAAGVG